MKSQPNYIYLTTLITSQLMIKCLDNLQGTPYYKRELKGRANIFMKELERISREDVGLIWGVKDDSLYLLMDYVESALNQFASIKPEEIGILKTIIEMYRADPDKVLAALEIKIVDEIKAA